MKIKMKGTVFGQRVEVEVFGTNKNLTFLFDGEPDKFLKVYLMHLLKERQPVAGTYTAPNWYDSINVYHTLHGRFFEGKVEVLEASNIDEMPYEEGVVY